MICVTDDEKELEITCKELGGFKDCDFKAVAKGMQELMMQMEEHLWEEHHERMTANLKQKLIHIIRRKFGPKVK